MSENHSHTLGTCEQCGGTFKETEDDGGDCHWCRGWYRCNECEYALPLEYFHLCEANGKRWVNAKCKVCQSPTIRYHHRSDVLEAYGVHGHLRTIYERAIPHYIRNHQIITRKVKGPGRGGNGKGKKLDAIQKAGGADLPFRDWLRIANALNETYRTERWRDLEPGRFNPGTPAHPDIGQAA